jgi:hypothetical protein
MEMRSTRATSAVERLNSRSGDLRYSMVRTSAELFYLVQVQASAAGAGAGTPVKLCEPMALDEFAQFVHAYGPQKPKRVSKLDVAFEKQLGTRRPISGQEENND